MKKTKSMPSVFIPHGGGPAFFMKGQMRDMFEPMAEFLAGLSDTLPYSPKAILIVTAHWEEKKVTLSSPETPQLNYDYYGFPAETYSLKYDSSGNPELAKKIKSLLNTQDIDCKIDSTVAWDHGVFIPLKVMYPEGQIPIVAMSLKQNLNPQEHIEIGRALKPLRDEGVLIIGSGMSYHNLSKLNGASKESIEFDHWLNQTLSLNSEQRNIELSNWKAAPFAKECHPREEHLMPLMVCAGASDMPANKIWQGLVVNARVSSWSFN